MKLSALLHQPFTQDISIEGITSDSRAIRRHYIYVAITGSRHDGRDYIPDAIANGASVIITDHPRLDAIPDHVEWITHPHPRLLLSQISAAFYGAQPETIAAVTGTNGKTSVVTFCRQIWHKLGVSAASLGTLGVQGVDVSAPVSMTTPDPVALHATLAEMSAAGVAYLAMEASSHGLDQHRLDGVKITAAGFTNLTRDHLDYHVTMEQYRDSKLRLFQDLLRDGGTAVANADIPEGEMIKNICQSRGLRFWSYGYNGDAFRILSRVPRPQGQAVRLNILGQEIEFILPLVGEFQLMNVLCAVGLVLARREKCLQAVIDILPQLTGVPGRLQFVPGHKDDAAIYVDYAHTPDALEQVLKALRPHTMGKLICVFGCGGDRDKGKRAVMGSIAHQLADHVILTDDNPRSEDPQIIRNMILESCPDADEIGNRRDAIRHAVRHAKKGDVILIAGKGHEHGQIFDDYVEPFDDVEEAQFAILNH
jgi:UDP-N-acetylmuramoyl-L-alanyl-D-glutamate--2,6-diaminopimelate ligase